MSSFPSKGGVNSSEEYGATSDVSAAISRDSSTQHPLQPQRSGEHRPHPSKRQQQQQQQQPPHHSHQGPAGAYEQPLPTHVAPPPPPQQQVQQGTLITNVPSTVSSTVPSLAAHTQQAISVESPLPPVVQRCLGDRSYEKRKNAALEIEALIKSLQEANNSAMIRSVVAVLSKDFCTSMNSNYRKGGLIGIAATAIGLMHNSRLYLDSLLPPVLHCFDDPESRVRYYACESLYNIAKVARTAILRYFNQIFDGLTKLFADVDVDVKNGANLLDRLVKDIVTESDTFHVEQFLPLLQNYIRRTNPYIRQLLVGWITVLDSVPDISMIDYLPDFLDGLFNMLSDSNREIRQAADSALSDFLREVRLSTVVEFGPMVSILVLQCHSKERLNRLTAVTWLAELIHHPYSGGDALLPYHAEVLGAIMRCISDGEVEIRQVAERTNDDLLTLVRDTGGGFELSPLLDTLTGELMGKEDVPTKMAALRWINMLLEKRKGDMAEFIADLLPVLLRTLSDPSDAVVLLTLQVLSRISLAPTASSASDPDEGENEGDDDPAAKEEEDDSQFQTVLNAILGLFATDRQLLESRGSLIVRKLCVLLNAKSVYIRMADALASYESSASDDGPGGADPFTLEFVGTMVQTLNLILLTAAELHGLRAILAESFNDQPMTFGPESFEKKSSAIAPTSSSTAIVAKSAVNDDGARVFSSLFRCWCHNPAATFSLCLLARAYGVAFALVKRFSELDVTVGFLLQIDKLVRLLESPVFVHLRLQLLDVEAPYHAPLLKSCYGLLMLLPQSDAFRSLNDRLTTVCNLRDNLGVSPTLGEDAVTPEMVNPAGLDSERLLARFDEVMAMHREARERGPDQVGGGHLPEQGGGSIAYGVAGGPPGGGGAGGHPNHPRSAYGVGYGAGATTPGSGPNRELLPIHNGGQGGYGIPTPRGSAGLAAGGSGDLRAG